MKVHIIEDEKSQAQAVADYLTRHGHSVSVSYTGETAVDDLLANSPDVMLVDMLMPGKNGDQILEQARARHVSAPAIVFTNLDTEFIDVEKLYRLGVKKVYLKADTKLDELAATLATVA